MSFRRGTVVLTLAAAVLAGVVFALWHWVALPHVERERTAAMETARQRLAALADLRQTTITRWAAHFRDDARFIARFPSVRDLCAADGEARRRAGAHVGEVLDDLVSHSDVQSVSVVDREGEVLVLRGQDTPDVRAILRRGARRALDDGATIDIVPRGSAHALVVWAAPVVPSDPSRPTAVLVGTTDPEGSLFPTVRTADGNTTESLLVVRTDGGIAFASPLTDGRPPFSLRFRDEDAPIAARHSLAGSTSGLFLDHRGHRVLAEARRVHETPWGVVVKTDEVEVLSGVRASLKREALILGGVLLALAVLATGAVRLSRANHVAALARAEARIASLIEDANDAIFIAAPDGRILRANRRAAEMYGWTEAELTSMRADALRAPSARDSCAGDLERALRDGRGVWQTTDVRADGTEFSVEVSARALDDEDGRKLVVVVRDVSARTAAERALRESEAHARARADETATLLDVVPAIVVVAHDRECRTLTGNRAAMEKLGVRSQPEFGESVRRYLTGADLWVSQGKRALDRGDAPMRRAARDGARYEGLDVDVRLPDGVIHSFVANVAPIPGPDGISRGAMLAGIDVTEHRRARNAAHVLSRAIEQTPSSVVITDVAGKIEYVNPAFTRVTGYAADEAIGKNPRFLRSGDTPPEVYTDLWGTIAGGRVWRGEFCNHRKDGTPCWVACVIAPIHDDGGRITQFVAIQEDVTARKTTEEALRAAERDLVQAQKMEAVGRLAGGVAHDFNNMLAIIVGYAELAAGGVPPESPLRSALTEILTAAERAEGLTRQLLAFSRKQVVEPRIIDLNATVRDALKMLHRLIGEDVELVSELDPAAGSVHADPGQVEQVLFNLAVNSRDAMPRGGRLTIGTSRLQVPEMPAGGPVPPGDWARIRVRDTGSGIPPEVRDHVFEPFFTTKARGKGTGLGLSTVHGIVHQAKGVVRFESEVGVGTVFDVYLPRVETGAPAASVAAAPAAPVLPMRVLVVEDEPQVRTLAQAMLEGLGHTVLTAGGGAEADAVLAGEIVLPDLLLTDVIMPQESGPELAARLRRKFPGLHVLFMSGYTDDALVRGGEIPAGTHLLRKPFSIAALAAAVRDATSGRS